MHVYGRVKINIKNYEFKANILGGAGIHDTNDLTIVQLYQGENKLVFHWDDDGVHFVLEQYAELDLHSASSLKQQSGLRHVVPLGISVEN
jgi:hypothetical protein